MPTAKPRSGREQDEARAPQRSPAMNSDECDPSSGACDDAACSRSRYVRATAAAAGQDHAAGDFTLEATEQAVADRLAGLSTDMAAMTAVSNIYRAANAVRNYVERRVLAPHELTWTAWVVLWVIWIWGEIESRHVASEAGISKGTLTGVQKTLMLKGLVDRTVHPDDARRVLLSLTDKGQELMTELFPEFNAEEAFVTGDLEAADVLQLARSLRAVVKRVETA